MRGHQRSKPVEQKQLEGTYQPCRDGETPQLRGNMDKLPPAPRSLKNEGLIYYNEQGNKLLNLGLLNEYNLSTFLSCCFLITKMEFFANKLNKAKDLRDISQYSSLYLKFQQAQRLTASEFGLTPAGLKNVRLPKEQKEKDGFENYV